MATDVVPTMNREVKNLAGQKFGRLTVLRFLGVNPKHHALWECLCECGNLKTAQTGNLRRGSIQSCGCFRRETASARLKTHGQTTSTEFRVWSGILQRTLNPNYHSWANYGGRGITVCDRWKDSFEAFYEDVGPRPDMKHTIDRKDNDGPYCKDNCRWATQRQQGRNKRNNHLVEFRGEKLPLAAWTERFGFRKNTIRSRLIAGWDMERIVTTPESEPLPFAPRRRKLRLVSGSSSAT